MTENYLLGHKILFISVDVQDDEVADAVTKNKEPMPLDRVPALTDKTFPTTIEEANIALVYFYIPCKYKYRGGSCCSPD